MSYATFVSRTLRICQSAVYGNERTEYYPYVTHAWPTLYIYESLYVQYSFLSERNLFCTDNYGA